MSLPSSPSNPSSGNTQEDLPPTMVKQGGGGSTGPGLVKRLLAARESSVVLVLFVICLFLFFAPEIGRLPWLRDHVDWLHVREQFFGPRNLQNLSLQIALLSIYAIGETIVIITGGIDLSLGSLIAFTGMVLAFAASRLDASAPRFAIVGAIVIALAVALGIGSLHATLIHRLRLPPFVVTLGSLTILRSQSLLMNGQLPISISQFGFLTYLANGHINILGYAIPVPVILVVGISVVAHLILTKTSIGRYVYSVGSNEQATRLSGINVGHVKMFAYGTSALLGGVAGIIFAGYGGQGDPLSGYGYELNAVAAAVIGGASLTGGQGSIAGTLLGVCLLNVILTGINFTLTKPTLWEGTVVGGVLLLAVLTSALQQRNQRNQKV